MSHATREFYESRALSYAEVDASAMARCEKSLGVAELADGQKVLDIACKDAVLLKTLQRAGLRVDYTGVDISERVLDKNRREALEGTFVQADVVQGLKLRAGSFDRIFALEILEHLTQPVKLLEEAHRLLAKDGLFVVSVPNPYYYMEMFNELRGFPDTEGHLFSFTTANMRALLEHCGFEVERTTGTYFLLPKSVRHPFRDARYFVLKRVPELLACSRVFACRKL